MDHKQEAPRVPEVEQLLTTIESFQNGEFGHLKIDITSLISHSHWVDINTTPEKVHKKLSENNIDFIAILKNDKPVGICSKSQLGIDLGNHYKSQNNLQTHIYDHLLENTLQVTREDSIVRVLISAFNRDGESFYDDIILTGKKGDYLGLISMKSLLILQNWVFMENIRQLKRQTKILDQQKKQIRKNMRLARQLQQAMYPQQFPSFPSHLSAEQSMLKFHHKQYSPDILGGDFFHIVCLSDYRAGLFLCDVLGHNVSSALITSMIRALVASYRPVADNPGTLLSQINNKFIELLCHYPDTMYATANYLIIDLEKAMFEYASAGHPVPIILNNLTGKCSQLSNSCQKNGPPLGILKDTNYDIATGKIKKGDLFLTYTDGVFEVFDRKNQQFGIDRLVESFSRHVSKPPHQIIKDVIQEAKDFAENKPFNDDVCLVGLEIAELLDQ